MEHAQAHPRHKKGAASGSWRPKSREETPDDGHSLFSLRRIEMLR
jgi:hypothetical protein